MDDCGLYTVVNRVVKMETHKEYSGERILVRVDILSNENEPIRSFIGNGNDVRKAVIRFILAYLQGHRCPHQRGTFSREHASYIGWEIHRADTDPGYEQV